MEFYGIKAVTAAVEMSFSQFNREVAFHFFNFVISIALFYNLVPNGVIEY